MHVAIIGTRGVPGRDGGFDTTPSCPPSTPGWVLGEPRFWNEQYLVQAFLSFNSAFRVLWTASAMNLAHPESLVSAFNPYRPGVTQPRSLSIQRIR